MALDFPSSPTNGQIYSNYYYDSTTGAWRANAPLAVGVPLGGTANYVLTKNTVTDFDTSWQPGPGLVPIIPPTVTISGGSATANSLGVVSFTSATSVKLNNVFSADYLNYKMLIDITTGPATDNINLNMRIDGAGATSYFYSGIRQYAGSTDAAASLGAATSLFLLGIAGRSGVAGASSDVTIMKPFATQNTKYNAHTGGNSTSAGEQQQHLMRGRLNDSTSYTGVEIFPGSSNISGTVQIFGYNS
jgi:hypothetical protein